MALFAADDKFGDVVTALQARGWRRLPFVGVPKFDLKWTNYAKVAWARVKPEQIVNHFQHAILFSRKDLFTELLYAYAASNEQGQILVDRCFPRTFDLSRAGDKELLEEWFRYSEAVAVLKNSLTDEPTATEAQVKAAMALAKSALEGDMFNRWRLERADDKAAEPQTSALPPLDLRGAVETILKQLAQHDPQFDAISADASNVWICKPSNLSQGRGIALCSSLREMEELTSDRQDPSAPESSPAKWIAQKYIERPLLLQGGRKFDIRQWVLLTELEPRPVAFWFKRSYLRFCSRRFELSRLQDRFTHLSNYSVQQHFASDCERNAGAPATESFDAMWSSERFQDALRETHGKDVWTDTILPQMQSSARHALRAVLPKLNVVGRGFEWLGFDFLVDGNHRVWLLEVNVSPDVSHSTDVTAELAPKATVDALNVVLDPEEMRTLDNEWLPFSLELPTS